MTAHLPRREKHYKMHLIHFNTNLVHWNSIYSNVQAIRAKNMENLVLLTLCKICSMMDSKGSDFQATNIDCKTSIAKTISAFGCAMNLYSLWFIYTQASFAHCCTLYIVRENESLDVYCQNLLNFHADAKQKCCDSAKLKEIYWAINILTFFLKFYEFWRLLSNESISNALKFS